MPTVQLNLNLTLTWAKHTRGGRKYITHMKNTWLVHCVLAGDF